MSSRSYSISIQKTTSKHSFVKRPKINLPFGKVLFFCLWMLQNIVTSMAQSSISRNDILDEQTFILTSDKLSPVEVKIPRKFLIRKDGLSEGVQIARVNASFFLPEEDIATKSHSIAIGNIKSESEQRQNFNGPLDLRTWILFSLKYEIDLGVSLKLWDLDRALEATHKMVGVDESGSLEMWAHSYDYRPDDAMTFRPIGGAGTKFVCLFSDKKYQCTMSYITHNHVLITASVPRRLMSSWKDIVNLIDKVVILKEIKG